MLAATLFQGFYGPFGWVHLGMGDRCLTADSYHRRGCGARTVRQRPLRGHLRPQSHSLTSRELRGMRVIQGPVAGSLRKQRRIKGGAAGTPSPPPSRPNSRALEAQGPGGVAQCPHPPQCEHGGVIRRGGLFQPNVLENPLSPPLSPFNCIPRGRGEPSLRPSHLPGPERLGRQREPPPAPAHQQLCL